MAGNYKKILLLKKDKDEALPNWDMWDDLSHSIESIELDRTQFEDCKLSAEEGSIEAALRLSDLYIWGEGTEISLKKAIKWAEFAAKSGDAAGMLHLGKLLLQDKETESEGIRWIKKAANCKNVDAIFEIAKCYENGRGVRRSETYALEIYELAGKRGCAEAFIRIAEIYDLRKLKKSKESVKDYYKRGFELYKKAADEGCAFSQNRVGELFESDKGVEHSFEEAFYYYSLAANKNSFMGLLNLGRCYEHKIGVEQSDLQAFQYYKRALQIRKNELSLNTLAEFFRRNSIYEEEFLCYKEIIRLRGVSLEYKAYSYHQLGLCYKLGKGVEQSYSKAIQYFKRAMETGRTKGAKEAAFSLGEAYYYGLMGLKVSYKTAFPYLQKAADQNHAEALYLLGKIFQLGKGVEKSLEKAISYYKLSSDQDFWEANDALGDIYRGLGKKVLEEKYYKRALFLLRKSTEEKNHRYDWEALGRYYKRGLGTKSSPEDAFICFKRSAEMDYSYGQEELGKCYEEGFGTEQSNEKAIEWYTKAAMQGRVSAQYNLAQLLDKLQNYEEAFKHWLQLANQTEDIITRRNAEIFLGIYTSFGLGTEKSTKMGLEYIQKASEGGNDIATFILALAYKNGSFGLRPDLEQSKCLYDEIANEIDCSHISKNLNHYLNEDDLNTLNNLRALKEAKDQELRRAKKLNNLLMNVFKKEEVSTPKKANNCFAAHKPLAVATQSESLNGQNIRKLP